METLGSKRKRRPDFDLNEIFEVQDQAIKDKETNENKRAK
jgi:hypothetical protein